MQKLFFRLFILFIAPVFLFAKGAIKGHISDSESNEALPAANVQILGTIQGASADVKGNFIISGVAPGIYSLRASMIGYRTVTVDNIKVMLDQTVEVTIKLKETTIEFDPIVVLGGRTQQRLDQAPVSISVVTSRDIERRNAVNIVQALETAPGVMFVGNQINIRGSTGYTFGAGNKVLLLLDGVPVYASDTGEFNWDMLPPLDIEQIEVLKGAGSTLWGASALGGVVNVITKDPSPDGRLLFAVTSGKYDRPYYDEWEWTNNSRLYYMREDLSYSKRLGPFGMRLAAGRFGSTGFTQIGDFTKYNLTGKLDYRFNNGIKWTGYAAYSYIDRGFFVQWKGQNDPYQVDESNLDNYAKTNQLNVYTKLAVPFSSRFAINFRASLVRTLMGNQFGSNANFNPAIGQGAEAQADWIPYPGHAITAGLQWQLDGGSTKYFGSHKGYFLGPYIQDEWKPLSSLRITTGLRYDRYQLFGGLKEDLFSPRIGVNWQPWASTTFRASAGSGFRAATIVERFLELTVMNFKIKSNPDLKAESCWAYDFGFRHYITDEWNVDISLFDNEYWELIEAHMDLLRGQVQFRNIPRARIQGIEATTNFSTQIRVAGLKLKPGLQLSMTAMNHKELEYDDPLPYRPKVIGTIKASIKSGPFMFETDYRYASRIEAVKIYPINDRVPMKFMDLRVSYEWGPLTAQLGVDNLLQYNYAPMESNLMPMRTFTAGVKGEF